MLFWWTSRPTNVVGAILVSTAGVLRMWQSPRASAVNPRGYAGAGRSILTRRMRCPTKDKIKSSRGVSLFPVRLTGETKSRSAAHVQRAEREADRLLRLANVHS